MENDYCIETILEKLEKVEDKELVSLVKKLIQERNYLSEIANIDTLTGLNNRRILPRIRDCSAAVMCDIDDFKHVNDTYGHNVGDIVLKIVTETIKRNTRINDYVCRLGGDEFLIAFVGCPEDVINKRIEDIREELSKRIVKLGLGENITISVGIVINSNLENINELIEKADEALYESKKNGRNKVTRYRSKKYKTIKLKKELQ